MNSVTRIFLFYVIPLSLLICICIVCAIWRECRRTRAGMINQHNIPIQSAVIVNPVEQSSRRNSSSPPPPYTAESISILDESLPSYERAINRPS